MEDLKRCFEELGAKPKTDSAEDLENWMIEYLVAQGKLPKVKQEVGKEQKQLKEQTDGGGSGHSAGQVATKPVGYQQLPRIATFSGEDSSKGDTTYDLWKFEVECLLEGGIYPEAVVCQAVRKSLKGQAAGTVKRMGTGVTVKQILRKLEDVYGVVDTGETLLAEFYGAKQGKDEDVTSWSCRLESILDRAMERHPVARDVMNEMLRSRFWNGLTQKLKDVSRHKFDSVQDFDALRRELRAIEREYKVTQLQEPHTKFQVKMVSAAEGEHESSAFKRLEGLVTQLSSQVEVIQQQQQVGKGQMQTGPGRGGGNEGMDQVGQRQGVTQHGWRGQGGAGQPFELPGGRGRGGQGPIGRGQGGGQFSGQPPAGGGPLRSGYGQEQQRGPPLQSGDARAMVCFKCKELGHFRQDCPRRFEPTCWSCGVLGHRQISCPALNSLEPLSRGGR